MCPCDRRKGSNVGAVVQIEEMRVTNNCGAQVQLMCIYGKSGRYLAENITVAATVSPRSGLTLNK